MKYIYPIHYKWDYMKGPNSKTNSKHREIKFHYKTAFQAMMQFYTLLDDKRCLELVETESNSGFYAVVGQAGPFIHYFLSVGYIMFF